MKKILYSLLILGLIPASVFAQVTTPTTFAELVGFFLGIINQIVPIIFGLAFLFIMWKLIDAWVLHPDDGSKREEGKTIIITGVIVLVIMVSIWGILNLLINSL
ncbi:MAG: hypothetical protein V4668_04385 [Patescibacteria group bacterium]